MGGMQKMEFYPGIGLQCKKCHDRGGSGVMTTVLMDVRTGLAGGGS